jgi:hypothetical protein
MLPMAVTALSEAGVDAQSVTAGTQSEAICLSACPTMLSDGFSAGGLE